MAKRKRDDVWDAVAAEWYPGGVPDRLLGKVRSAVKCFRDQGITGEQVPLIAENYRKSKQYGDCACTVDAVANHAGERGLRPGNSQLMQARYERWKLTVPVEIAELDGAWYVFLVVAGKAGTLNDMLPYARRQCHVASIGYADSSAVKAAIAELSDFATFFGKAR